MPVYQRAPRLHEQPGLPTEFEIPAPPAAPTPPVFSLLYLLPGLVMPAIYLLTATAGSNLIALLAMAGLWPAIYAAGHLARRRAYSRALRERQRQYTDALQAVRRTLATYQADLRRVLLRIHPGLDEDLRRARQLDRLWERAPGDDDFLEVRLGLGEIALPVVIKTPRRDPFQRDPLVEAAHRVSTEYATVGDAPVRLRLDEHAAVGLTGPAAADGARAWLIQIAAHHAPTDVQIAAFFPEAEHAAWAWLRWLPHAAWQERRALAEGPDRSRLLALAGQLVEMLSRRLHQGQSPLPHWIIVLADPRLIEDSPLFHLVLTQGAAIGATFIILADRLPAGCTLMVEQPDSEHAQLITTASSRRDNYVPDRLSLDEAEAFARVMAPIQLRQAVASTAIPASAPLLDLLRQTSSDVDIDANWDTNRAWQSLAVPIGLRAGGQPLRLDLHERGAGPHGLIAGATGSGKSELQQTLVAALAATFRPSEIAFLFIDYKGGGAFGIFERLPHTAGLLTNLDDHLTYRALITIKAELRRRQALLAQANVSHIDDYQRQQSVISHQSSVIISHQSHGDASPSSAGNDLAPLPRLIILVDEFAELIAAQPDFIRELVSAVRVGRSLGVHLILATQKPAGVVNDQIWGNARFRICLRVEQPEDSREVLKRPDAASLARPGQAYFQVGADEVFELFQAGWANAPQVEPVDDAAIYEVLLDGMRRPITPVVERTARGSQVAALVEQINQAAEQRREPSARALWLPPLPDQIVLDLVRPLEGWNGQAWTPSSAWLSPVAGLLDDPADQGQRPLRLDLTGGLAIYGAPGTGKTTLLQTLLTSLALDHPPTDLNLYLIDFGRHGLAVFEALPHAGGLVEPSDPERLARLLRHLGAVLERRKSRFAKLGVGTLAAYRSAGQSLPAIVVAIDNAPALIAAHPDAEEALAHLAREGVGLGVYLVLTANNPALLRRRLAESLAMAVALPLAEAADVIEAVGRRPGPRPIRLPGRGIVRGNPPLEFQAALPVGVSTETGIDLARSLALRDRVDRLQRSWSGPRVYPIPVLPPVVGLDDLLARVPEGRPLGLDVDSLEPVSLEANEGPHSLIVGPSGSGRTALLRTWLTVLARRPIGPALRLLILDRLGDLAGLPAVYFTDAAGLLAAAEAAQDAVVIALDGWGVADLAYAGRLEALLTSRDRHRSILIATDLGTAARFGMARLRPAILLGSDAADALAFGLRVSSGFVDPPGQGWLVRRQARHVRFALAQQPAMRGVEICAPS